MSTILISKNNIDFQILNTEKLNETIELVNELFVEQEYAVKYAGLTKKTFLKFAELYCKASISTGLSIICNL